MHMKRTRYFLAALAALTVSVAASAQSKSFSLGKWVELHNAILKELNRSYVDSLEKRWIPIPCTSRRKSRKTSR